MIKLYNVPNVNVIMQFMRRMSPGDAELLPCCVTLIRPVTSQARPINKETDTACSLQVAISVTDENFIECWPRIVWKERFIGAIQSETLTNVIANVPLFPEISLPFFPLQWNTHFEKKYL